MWPFDKKEIKETKFSFKHDKKSDDITDDEAESIYSNIKSNKVIPLTQFLLSILLQFD